MSEGESARRVDDAVTNRRDISEIKDQLGRLTEAVQKMILLDERQSNLAKHVNEVDARVSRIEGTVSTMKEHLIAQIVELERKHEKTRSYVAGAVAVIAVGWALFQAVSPYIIRSIHS